ncbi:MAG: hypothetical protein ACRELC_08960 [Gemmatimonadota bacterium]
MKRRYGSAGVALAGLLTLVTGCSDDGAIGPAGADELQGDEAAFLATAASEVLDVILDGEADARESLGDPAPTLEESGAVALSLAPIVTEFQFRRVAECPAGGQIVAEGSGVHTADRETHTTTVEYSGTKDIDRCARERGDVVITLDGGGTFEGFRKKMNGRFYGLQTHDQAGRFEWHTSDGRSGACDYEIHVVWDPATGTKTVTGSICDHEIQRTVTRDGA